MNKVKLDEIDHQILDILIDNMRTPFTDIAKKLLISAGTVHVRVKKMEDAGIIKGSSLTLDYKKIGLFVYCLHRYISRENSPDKIRIGASFRNSERYSSTYNYWKVQHLLQGSC